MQQLVALFKITLLFNLILLTACTSLAKMEEPSVEVISIEPLAQTDRPRFRLGLKMVNPNKQDLTINGLSYDLSLMGQKLVTGAAPVAKTLPAYGETLMHVDAEINVFRLLGLVGKLLNAANSNSTENFAYQLNGKVDVAGLMFPVKINKSGTFDEYFFNQLLGYQ